MAKTRKKAFTGFGVAMLFVLAFAIFFYLTCRTVVVKGRSMEKTLHTGQRLLVCKAYWLVGEIRQKDIVVVQDNNVDGYIVKRVYKLPGQEVESANAPRSHKLSEGPFIVPKDMLYVLGDNRPESEDSRAFGPVDMSKVIGKVIVW